MHHGYNYALGQITVTPMALLMTYLASPTVAASMPVERVHLHEHRSKGVAGR